MTAFLVITVCTLLTMSVRWEQYESATQNPNHQEFDLNLYVCDTASLIVPSQVAYPLKAILDTVHCVKVLRVDK